MTEWTMPAVKTLEQFDWNCVGGADPGAGPPGVRAARPERGVAGPQRRGQDPHRTALGQRAVIAGHKVRFIVSVGSTPS